MSFLRSKPIEEELKEEAREEPASRQPAQQVIEGGPILAVDIGSVHTRAVLLDVVDDHYTFVARGITPTTTFEPWNDILEGVYTVIGQLADVTERTFVDQNGELVMPEADDLYGVQAFYGTASAGQPIRTVLVGLVDDISLQSGRRAADSIYLSIVDTISLSDRRTIDKKLDAIISANADLIMVVGGTDGGAVESLTRELEILVLAYSLLDIRSRPPLLFAGNNQLADDIKTAGDEIGIQVITAPNVRPTLETEYLEGVQQELAGLYHRQKSRNTPGFSSVGTWTSDGMYPTSQGYSRLINLMAGLNKQNVIGIDVGSSNTTVAAHVDGHRYLNVFGDMGVGHAAGNVFERLRPAAIRRWLTFDLSEDEILNSAHNLSVYPHTVPVTHESAELLYAMTREIMRYAIRSARRSWRGASQHGLLPPFETIVLSGATLGSPPHIGWSVLAALDAIQPTRTTRLLLDPHGLAATLGAMAATRPHVVVQALETDSFFDVGPVFSAVGRARQGETVLRGTLRADGEEDSTSFAVRFGEITTLPLTPGMTAELTLKPRRVQIDGSGRRRKIKVKGGQLGVILDARGRPWRVPRNRSDRQKQMLQWQQSILGKE